jgi:hypothetical protein
MTRAANRTIDPLTNSTSPGGLGARFVETSQTTSRLTSAAKGHLCDGAHKIGLPDPRGPETRVRESQVARCRSDAWHSGTGARDRVTSFCDSSDERPLIMSAIKKGL